ncbi:NLR family CARD domain-containing protein 3-like isoform X5 [Montipora foliosa]|uniref:NLR family CARD domain-containing protein 3-like isoform X5 n=1 Tax=Montipora foliosa TaxID=591990 RepID=UPI0035F214BD
MASGSWQHSQELGPNKVRVTILASEWGSSKGGLSTINRELAIQLAKFPDLEITYFLPKCSEEDKEVARNHDIKILEATRLLGYEELECLSFPPEHLRIDVIVGHGVKLGRQAQVIRNSHKCKWIQVIHTDPEELSMFKCYENPISRGEEKHTVEVELCKTANLVLGVGPKLAEAFRKYLRSCQKDQGVFNFTPGIFDEFLSVQQVSEERKQCSVLVFGRGDAEDFELKGFDIAAKSVAVLPDIQLVFVGADDGKHEEIANRLLECGIPKNRLRVRGYVESREKLKELFCEVDLVLMPSRTEGFGLTGLEALSAGLPVIVSKNSGFGEALCNVPSGSSFVIDSEDPNAWTAAIRDIWNKNRQTRLDEAKVLRDSYGTKYSWSEQCKDLIKKMINLVNDASCEPQMSSEEQGKLKRKSHISLTDHGLSQKKARGEYKESKQHSEMLKQWKSDEDSTKVMIGEVQEMSKPMMDKLCEMEEMLKQLKSQGDSSNTKHGETEDAADFIDVIRQLYKRREGWLAPFPWCEEFRFHLDNIFTRLKMVSRKKERGVKTDSIVNMLEIFKPHEECPQPRKVLIEGQPGVGKTTYCNKIAYDWAKNCKTDDPFPDVQVLLLLKCKDINSELREAIDDQLLPKDIKKEEREKFFTFVWEHQAKVLLVLDGLDELPTHKLPVYKEIIQGRMLSKCYLVVTARHETGISLREFCDTLLEVEGFTKNDAEDFIRRYFKTERHLAQKLLHKLRSDKSLSEITANPLNTALLCLLCNDFQGDLPKGRTLLYHEIVQCVLRKYRRKKELPETDEDLTQLYHTELKHLGCIALNGLLNDEMYFDDSACQNGTSSLIPELGFLSAQPGRSKRRPGRCYGFLHKSFQEFFAAVYLSCHLIDEEMNPDGLVADTRYFREFQQVLMFTCGILAQQCEAKAMALMASIASQINQSNGKVSRDYLWTALNCVKECEKEQGTFEKELARSLGSLLEIQRISCRQQIGDSGAAILAHAMATNSTVTEMDLLGNGIGDSGAAALAEVVEINSTLTHLYLSGNGIGDSGAAALAKAVEINSTLTHVNLFDNRIGDSGAAALAKAVEINSTLTDLDLSYNGIGDLGAAALAKAMEINSTLTELHLSHNGIGDSGAAALAKAVEINSTLTRLNLRGNGIGDSGAAALAKAVEINSTLTHLNLSFNGIGDSGAAALAKAVEINSTLTHLNLPRSNTSWQGVTRHHNAPTSASHDVTRRLKVQLNVTTRH